MNGMKSICLTLAVIAGVVLAVPTNPLGRDVNATTTPGPVAPAGTPATVGSPKVEPKPATNTTVRPAAAPKQSASEAPIPAEKSEEEKVELVAFELPVSDESEPERIFEARESSEDSDADELVGAAKSEQFADEMQGDEPAFGASEKNQGARSSADAKVAGDAQGAKPAEKVEAARQADKAEEAKEAVKAEEPEEDEEAEEDENDEEAKESEVTFIARVAEVSKAAVGAEKVADPKKGEEVEKEDEKSVVAKAAGVPEAKKEEEPKGTTEAKEIKDEKEGKGAEAEVGSPQTQSADFQREKMIDEMIEKLKKLKDVNQAN